MDHPRRDLPGMVLVALELVRAGATTVILPAQMSWIHATFADLDATVVQHARTSTLPVIHWLSRIGQTIFVIDNEGYLSSDRHAMLTQRIADLQVGALVAGYFVWGEASGQALAKADPVLAPKVQATGAPRFDLLSARWRDMLHFERQNYILLNPNFNGVNPYHGNPERVRVDMVKGGWDPAYLDTFLAEMRRGFADFVELCATLPRRLPHRQFVLRPHPFEAPEPYAKAIAGLSNVHLNTEGDVTPVLANASHLVHLNCNTSVEARLLGLKPIQASFLNSELLSNHMPLYTGVSIKAESLDDLCRLLEDDALLAARDNSAGIFERWIRPSFHLCDGRAANRVADAVLAGTRPRGPRQTVKESLGTRLKRQAKLVLSGTIGTGAIQAVRRNLHPDRRVKVFTAEHVRAMLTAYCAKEGIPVPPVRRLRSPWTGLPMSGIQIG